MKNLVFGDRYVIKEKIGAGGMAEVYKAFDMTLDRMVAVKVLHAQYASDEDFVARFRREARAAAHLNQPNIVNVYDWGSENDTYFIVMEYLVGQNLKQIIADRGQLPAQFAVDIGRQVAAALQFAHKNNIVHRDIKPHNIVITDEGEVKVTDFGIARSSASNVTQTGTIMGTAHYLSPEQAGGNEVGAASDIYSLGVVLYEMLAGQVPFSGDSPVAVALKHIQEPPRSLNKLNKDVPPELEAIVAKAMAKNPADRYLSAAEMREDLGRCAEGAPVRASLSAADNDRTMMITRPLGERPVQNRGGRRWIKITALIISLMLLFAGSAWATTYFLGRAPKNKVPDLIGKALDDAAGLAAKKQFNVKVGERVFSDNIPAGRVISQKPKHNTELTAGEVITLRLSKGRELITVPNLQNKTLSQVTVMFARLGLNIGEADRDYNNEVPEDSVILQNPPPDKRVKKGSYVDLVISKGPRPLKTPDLIGKTAGQAQSTLASMSLEMTKNEEYNDEIEAGLVISQSPDDGVPIERGDQVTVVVSKGPELVDVPDLKNLDEDEAKTKLLDAGLTPQFKDSITDNADSFGKIVAQSPESGSSARKGTTVTAWIGRAPS